jgi:soluble lytic murein transglycosylase
MFRGLLLLFFSFQTQANVFVSEFAHINFSKDDEAVARNLHQILRELRVDRVDGKKVQILNSALKKSDAFADLKPLVEQLEKIAKIGNSLESFHESCGKNVTGVDIKKVNATYKNLDQQIRRYCRGTFLKIASAQNAKTKISEETKGKNLLFLNRSIGYYLRGERKELFTKFFSQLDKSSPFHQTINELISEKYINKKITPYESIIQSLDLNKELTSYVQAQGVANSESKKLFNQEFRRIYDEYRTTFDSGNVTKAIETANRLMTFHKANSHLISEEMSWVRFVLIGKQLAYTEHTKATIEILDYSLNVAQANGNQEQIDDSVFQLIWVGIIKKDYKESLRIIEAYKLLENFSKYDSRIKFWIAHIIDQRGEKTLANHLYRQIIENSPMNFYSIIAQKELTSRGKMNQEEVKTAAVTIKETQIYEYSKEFENSIKRLKVWLKLDIDTISNAELSDIITKNPEEIFLAQKSRLPAAEENFRQFLVKNLAALFNNHEKYLHTFRLVHQSLGDPNVQADEEILSYLFPFQYFDRIKNMAKDIDPIVIISLIRQESAFNPRAKSSVGARGLMQLMPMTAKQMNKRVKVNDLNKPDVNLELGIKYLKRLLSKYDGNLVHTLAAYNAGERRVAEWQKTVFTSEDPLIQIESIPFKETRNYVKLIYRNMYFYRLLTNEPAIRLPIADSFKTSLNTTN